MEEKISNSLRKALYSRWIILNFNAIALTWAKPPIIIHECPRILKT